MTKIETIIEKEAKNLGFAAVGFARAEDTETHAEFIEWIKAGYAGEMRFLSKNLALRSSPLCLEKEAESVIVLAARYMPDLTSGFSGCVSKTDYHDLLRSKARKLAMILAEKHNKNTPFKCRICVDSAPLAEREWAARAGLGWIGKNGYLVNGETGCCVLLCEILVNIRLEPSNPALDRCGNCRICVNACPTGAIQNNRLIDARKCISYLTIEYKGVIDESLRPLMGNSIFGCDRCGAVCPFNHGKSLQPMPELTERPELPDAMECLLMTREMFKRRFRGTSVDRTGHEFIRRNAAIVLGNSGDKSVIPALEQAVGGESALVAEHAAWAIERIKHG